MRKLLMGMLIACSATLATAAPTTGSRNVIADPDQIHALMSKAGFSVERKKDQGEDYLRASRGKNAYYFNVYFYGCDEKTTRNCKSIQFFAAFEPTKKPTLEAMNLYARENRWGRVYLDKANDPVIEMDLDLEKGGMSEALLLDNVDYFEAVMNEFARFAFKD